MDTRYTLPWVRVPIGLDPIIGLLPIAGDTVTLLIGLAMLAESRRLRLGWRVHTAIMLNLIVDWVLGLIPGVDLLLDTLFRAHRRNARLIRESAEARYPDESVAGQPGGP
jgi:hypothetical protein